MSIPVEGSTSTSSTKAIESIPIKDEYLSTTAEPIVPPFLVPHTSPSDSKYTSNVDISLSLGSVNANSHLCQRIVLPEPVSALLTPV